MTEEIVTRLRDVASWCPDDDEPDEGFILLAKAADEIERLRERVDRLEWALMHPTTADAEALRTGLLEASLFGSPEGDDR